MPQLASGTRKAAKQYGCEWCRVLIEPGDVHEFWVWLEDKRAVTLRAHPDCLAALKDSIGDSDGEYCGEGHDRGAPCEDH